jgi:hypothetical protein
MTLTLIQEQMWPPEFQTTDRVWQKETQMQPTVPTSLEKQGVTQETFNKLLTWGWFDIAGNSLDWQYWQPDPDRQGRRRV